MQINVWEKQKVFEKKSCLGEVVVKLDNLDLSQVAPSYYTLFTISAADLGSEDSLSLWG